MRTSLIQRGLGMALALTLVLAAPLTVRAEDTPREIIPLTEDHVTLEHAEYEYTGEEIRPNVTVRVEDTLLTLDQHYTLDFADNVEVGTATVTVTGIATSGYEGEVEIPFAIVEKQPDPTQLEESHVKLDKTKFVFDGKAIEPKVTVTVEDTVLHAGEDYILSFENNDKPGTAYAIVTAMEESGYTGTVRIPFTIQESPKAPEYTITKGDGGKWYLKSTKNLSFAVSGDAAKFVGVSVDGKRISDSSYTVKKDVITLKSTYLNTLKAGSHTIAIHFDDGKAEGSFRVLEGLDDSNPDTGDRIHLWTAVLFVSLTGLTGMGFAFRKKIWK